MSRGVLGWALCALALVLAGPACATDTVYYYYTDALHSAVAVTDAQGNVIERTTYAPYGQVLNRDLRDGPGYGGHAEDPETQLVYMQQRYYDAQSGRFLSVDPVAATEDGGNFNRYAYASNNPYRYTDPDGRESGNLSLRSAEYMQGNLHAFDSMESDFSPESAKTMAAIGVLAVGAMGADEAIGAAGAVGAAARYVVGKIASAVTRQAARDDFTGNGGVKGAVKEFGRASGKEIDTGKQGVRVKLRSNGERVEMHDSTGKNPKVPKGTRTIKVQDKNGEVIKTIRYPDPKQHDGTTFSEPNG